MNDLRHELDRSARLVEPSEPSLERLMRRRTRKARYEKTSAFVLSLVVAGAALGGTLFALRGEGGRDVVPGSGEYRVPPDLAIQPGHYSYVKTVRISPGGETSIESWWALDESGRIDSVSNDPNYGPPMSGTFGPGEFPAEPEGRSDLMALPTDPDTLATRFGSGARPRVPLRSPP